MVVSVNPMPKIDAVNVEEHIRMQTDRLLNAANQLFAERGYLDTDFGDIAQAIGLARNSLYRYYPNKEHILLACVRRQTDQVMQRFRALDDDGLEARQQIDAWAKLRLEIAADPDQAAMERAAEAGRSAAEIAPEILSLQQAPDTLLLTAVDTVVADTRRNAHTLTAFIAGLARAAIEQIRGGARRKEIERELLETIDRLLHEQPNE